MSAGSALRVPKIRRFKLRARHLRPYMPRLVRRFMSRWHAIALERLLDEEHRFLDDDPRDHAARMAALTRMKDHQNAEIFWRTGTILPDLYSDDPAARRVWDNMQTVNEDFHKAESLGAGEVFLDILRNRPEVRYRLPDGTRRVAVYNTETSTYNVVVDGRLISVSPVLFARTFTDGRCLPDHQGSS